MQYILKEDIPPFKKGQKVDTLTGSSLMQQYPGKVMPIVTQEHVNEKEAAKIVDEANTEPTVEQPKKKSKKSKK